MIANLKDPNDPNADEDGAKEPAKKCMFVKDSINNKLLIVKCYEGDGALHQGSEPTERFSIL